MKNIVVFENVSKIYNKNQYALNNVNLKIGEGMFGLLGPNGAGKSTFMKSLITLITPEKGRIMVEGYDTRTHSLEVRDIVGYLPQDFSIYPNLTAEEFLDYIAQINNLGSKKIRKKRIEEVLSKVNLLEVKNKKVGGFSGGMKRRLGIANAILKDPKILIVDEPTAGLDPEERIRFRMLLVELSRQKCVILSTHIVEDIASSCETIALLDKGQIQYLGSPIEFILKAKEKVREFKVFTQEDILRLKDKYEIISTKRTSSGTFLRVVGESFSNELENIEVEPNLEDAYMYFMKYGQGEIGHV